MSASQRVTDPPPCCTLAQALHPGLKALGVHIPQSRVKIQAQQRAGEDTEEEAQAAVMAKQGKQDANLQHLVEDHLAAKAASQWEDTNMDLDLIEPQPVNMESEDKPNNVIDISSSDVEGDIPLRRILSAIEEDLDTNGFAMEEDKEDEPEPLHKVSSQGICALQWLIVLEVLSQEEKKRLARKQKEKAIADARALVFEVVSKPTRLSQVVGPPVPNGATSLLSRDTP